MAAHAYHAPATVEEALALLAERPDARPVAGGTDLVVGARHGKSTLPDELVGIHRLAGLDGLSLDADGTLRIGALVSHHALETAQIVRDGFTALADSSALVGSPATRSTGTLGGNLANASPAMETGSPLLVLSAVVEARSLGGSREIPIDELWTGPGRSTLQPAELITEVRVPAAAAGSGSAYMRLEYRRAMEIAVVGAAALVTLDGGRISAARLALTAVAPTCLRVAAAEESLVGAEPSAEALGAAGDLAAEAARPISDVRGSDAYRRAMVAVIARRALEVAVRRARGEHVGVPANRAVGVNEGRS